LHRSFSGGIKTRIVRFSPTAISRLRHDGSDDAGFNRLRWDKRPAKADRLETLGRMLEKIERGRAALATADHHDRILS
jgi:hypothetical protein